MAWKTVDDWVATLKADPLVFHQEDNFRLAVEAYKNRDCEDLERSREWASIRGSIQEMQDAYYRSYQQDTTCNKKGHA